MAEYIEIGRDDNERSMEAPKELAISNLHECIKRIYPPTMYPESSQAYYDRARNAVAFILGEGGEQLIDDLRSSVEGEYAKVPKLNEGKDLGVCLYWVKTQSSDRRIVFQVNSLGDLGVQFLNLANQISQLRDYACSTFNEQHLQMQLLTMNIPHCATRDNKDDSFTREVERLAQLDALDYSTALNGKRMGFPG